MHRVPADFRVSSLNHMLYCFQSKNESFLLSVLRSFKSLPGASTIAILLVFREVSKILESYISSRQQNQIHPRLEGFPRPVPSPRSGHSLSSGPSETSLGKFSACSMFLGVLSIGMLGSRVATSSVASQLLQSLWLLSGQLCPGCPGLMDS